MLFRLKTKENKHRITNNEKIWVKKPLRRVNLHKNVCTKHFDSVKGVGGGGERSLNSTA